MMTKTASTRSAFLLILLLGLLLRLWGLGFGLPFEYHVDERIMVHEAMALAADPLNTTFFNYGTFYPMVQAGVQGLHFLFDWFTGIAPDLEAFRSAWRADPTAVILWARGSSLFFFGVTLLLIVRIGRRRHSEEMGLLAGLAFAVLPIACHFAHYATPQSLLALLVTASAERALCYLDENRRRDLLLSAVFAGLSAAAKYPLAVALTIPMSAVLVQTQEGRRDRGRWMIFAGAAGALAFFAGSFHILLNPAEFWNDFSFQFEHQYASATIPAGSSGWTELARIMIGAWGGPLLITTILSGAFVLWRRDRRDLPLYVFAPVYLLGVGSSVQVSPRYLVVVTPILALLAAYGFVRLAERFRATPWGTRMLFTLILLAPLMISIETNKILAAPDTRDEARAWMLKNLPRHWNVMMDDFPVVFPVVTEEEFPNLQRVRNLDCMRYQDVAAGGADVIVVSNHRHAWKYWDFDHFRGVDRPVDPREEAFYSALAREGRLIAQFEKEDPGESYMLDHFGFHNPAIWIFLLPNRVEETYE